MPANPANTQVRIGFEADEGFGNPAAWQDMRILSETLGSDIPQIEDDSILATGEREVGLPTKIIPGGDLNLNYHAEDHAKLLACFMGAGATPVQAPTGVYTHKLAISETDVDFGKLAIEVSRDLDNVLASPVKRPEIYVGALVSQLTFNTGPRSLLNGAASIATPRFHFFSDAVQLAGTSTDPFIRGFGTFANLRSADGDVFVKVTTAPSGGNVGIKVKLGAASTYDGTEITVPTAVWTAITDENDAGIGTDDLPVELYWPNLTGVILDDEWRFDRERAVWSQTLPTSSPFNEIFITILLDGVKFRTRDLSLTATRPASFDEAIGGRFLENDQVLEFGRRETSGSLNRRALDTDLVDRLLRKEPFALRIDALSTLIGATGVRRSLSLVMMNCVASGRTPSVGGADTFDEPIDFTAHPSADVTYPDALTFELVNSQASLA